MSDPFVNRLERTEKRLRTKVGYGQRERHVLVQPVLAVEILRRCHWTIDFHPGEPVLVDPGAPIKFDREGKPEKPATFDLGAKTIWHYIGYLHPVDASFCFLARPSMWDRITSADRYHKIIHQAFNALSRHLIKDHREYPLMMIPRVPGGKLIEVITLNGKFLVNNTETAGDLFVDRNTRHLGSTCESRLERLEAFGGVEARDRGIAEVQRKLIEFASKARQPLLPFGDESATDD